MSENENELIVGKEPINGENIMYILPDHLQSIKFIESNIFDSAIIKDCKAGLINSLTLSYIFRAMKPEGRVEIVISQPISVMQSLDSKQIEAHAEHVGFENISTEDTMYEDDINGRKFPTLSVIFYKPSRDKDNQRIDLRKEVKKTTTSTTTYKKKKK